MVHLRWIGFGAFFVASLVIAGRPLLLARRTGQIPEFLIGVAAFGLGPLHDALSMLAFLFASRSLALSATLMGSALLATHVGPRLERHRAAAGRARYPRRRAELARRLPCRIASRFRSRAASPTSA